MKNTFKYDCYTHCKEGTLMATESILDLLNTLDGNMFDGLILTDTNSYKGYKFYDENMRHMFSYMGIIKGIEYDTSDLGKTIVITPSNVKLDILTCRGLSAPQLLDIVHDYGGIVGSTIDTNDYDFDFYMNCKNRKSLGGSNCHNFNSIGESYSEFEKKIYNEDEFIAYIKENRPYTSEINTKSSNNPLYRIHNKIQSIIHYPRRIKLLKKI